MGRLKVFNVVRECNLSNPHGGEILHIEPPNLYELALPRYILELLADQLQTLKDFGSIDYEIDDDPQVDNQIESASISEITRIVRGSNSRVASDVNESLTGLVTIDGVPLDEDDIVLLVNQINLVENGLWKIIDGPWVRPDDFADGIHAGGTYVWVNQGATYNDTGWLCTTNYPFDVVGTNNLNFQQYSGILGAGDGLYEFVGNLNVGENPTGAIKANADDIALQVNGIQLAITGPSPGILGLAAGGVSSVEINLSAVGSGLVGGGGSPVAIGASTLTGILVSANYPSVVVDGQTLEIIGAAQGYLQIKNSGVGVLQVHPSLAGAGLSGGAGSPFSVNVGAGLYIVVDNIAVNPLSLISGGAAEVDGDKLDIDYIPTNYIRTINPPDSNTVVELTSHLTGINAKFGTLKDGAYVVFHYGAGDPNGSVTGNRGDLYFRTATNEVHINYSDPSPGVNWRKMT